MIWLKLYNMNSLWTVQLYLKQVAPYSVFNITLTHKDLFKNPCITAQRCRCTVLIVFRHPIFEVAPKLTSFSSVNKKCFFLVSYCMSVIDLFLSTSIVPVRSQWHCLCYVQIRQLRILYLLEQWQHIAATDCCSCYSGTAWAVSTSAFTKPHASQGDPKAISLR